MALAEFVNDAMRRIARVHPLDDPSQMSKPRATITLGAAGVALFLAELARAREGAAQRRIAKRAREWIRAAESSLRQPHTAYGFPNHPFSAAHGGIGLLAGRAGVYTVAARIAFLLGDEGGLRLAASRFVDAWQLACSRKLPVELFAGFTGFMDGARDFEAHCPILGLELSDRVRSVGQAAYARVLASFAQLPSGRLPKGMLLGMAHGLAGNLHSVLAWDRRPSRPVAKVLDQLLDQATIEGEIALWPVAVGGDVADPMWATWCNGSSGQIYVWCRAYEVFRDERYLTAARLAAQTTSVLSTGGIAGVCCGTAGQAFALHRYFRLTNDRWYRRRATARARRACAEALLSRESAFGPSWALSYFRGTAGIAHLAFMLDARQTPYLPLVEGRE